jgi:RNA polymerase sigma-70 factor (ECF subfamily)
MANNLVLDRLRETRRRGRRERNWTGELHGEPDLAFEVADPSPTAEQQLVDREEAQRLREAIEQLPPGAKRVLRLHKIDGLSHAEVAASLGISKSAVEKHMAVAMTHLRRMLRDWGDD